MCQEDVMSRNYMSLKTVYSDGVFGKDGIKDLERARYNLGYLAKEVMKKFPNGDALTNGRAYRTVVLKGEDFTDGERTISNIRNIAKEMGFVTPPPDIARLLRKSVSDDEIASMGLWWLVVMHEPITASDGYPRVLGINRAYEGRRFESYFCLSDDKWYHDGGFVFLAPPATL